MTNTSEQIFRKTAVDATEKVFSTAVDAEYLNGIILHNCKSYPPPT